MYNSIWMGFSRSAVAAAVAIVVAAPALAQNTTAAVAGRVTDAGGKAVAGAQVAIRHDESGSLNSAVTDADGRYVARGLRVGGPYTVTISKDGTTEKREGIFLTLAETTSLDAQIGGAVVQITGQSAGSDKFSRSAMGAGTSIGSRELNAQASIQRNLQDYARTDPRLSQTDKERGEISAAGQNSRFNSITIDGVKTNDTFGLEANNLPTAKQPISIDAIQSVQVNVSNYDATQKGYTGANINAVTKSGTNEFKGSVYYVYRDDDLAGQRLLSRAADTYAPAAPFVESTRGFTLGGPIIKDKLFFFGSYEELHSSRNAPDFGPIGSSVTNVAITPAFIDAVSAAAKTTYGIDLGNSSIPGGTQLTVKDTLLKLDWNISDDHRASLRYAKTAQTEPFFTNFTSTNLSLSSNWYSIDKTLETLVGQWFADWTPTFSTELKLSRRSYDSISNPGSHLPQMTFALTSTVPAGFSSGTRTLFTGTERSRQDNILRTKTNDGYIGANWQVGDHELKFGADASRNEIFNAFIQDIYGNYTFRCVNSSSSYTYNFTSAAVTCTDPAQTEAAILENFQRGRPFSYSVKTPLAGKTIADGEARWTLTETGAFLQDTWNVNKQLTLLAGLRVDNQSTGDKPAFNASASAAPGAANAIGRATGGFGLDNSETLDGATLVQPRFGFNFTLPTERKMQLRGGFGLFQGAAPSVWLSNPYSNTGVAVTTLGCGTGSFGACLNTNGQFSANADAPYLPNASAPAADIDFLQHGLGQPAVWKMNLAFETELPWAGLIAGAEVLHTKVKQALYYQHLNLGAPTAIGAADGRSLYYNAQGRNAACWNPTTGASITTGACATATTAAPLTRSLSNASFNNVLLATQTSKGGGDVLTLSLQQPVRDGLSWGTAYSRTTSKEVSPLTSSVSNSNWAARSSFNPNEEVAANSAYLVRDRVSANLSWSQAFDGKHRTTFGVFYEGRSGKPYSWTYRNDFNGDGTIGNDLMYIPKGPGSGEVVFTGLGENAFWQVVNAYPELNDSRGSVVKRNSTLSPFVNTFDVRLSQELPGFASSHKATLTFDILNIGNLLNRRWGRTDEMAFQSGGGANRTFVNFGGIDSSGRYVYNVVAPNDYTTRQAKGESQWAAQVTVKYEF